MGTAFSLKTLSSYRIVIQSCCSVFATAMLVAALVS